MAHHRRPRRLRIAEDDHAAHALAVPYEVLLEGQDVVALAQLVVVPPEARLDVDP